MAKANESPILKGADGIARCWWCGSDEEYIRYHDLEWGQPVEDDQRLFEKICLEGFQAGLSWITILRKRENFRKAFFDFNIPRVASLGRRDVNRIVKDQGIVRHRGKIESTINNAARAIDLANEFGSLANYFWQYEQKRRPVIKTKSDIPAATEQSTLMSKDLKRRGWSFVGPTTCYAFMQSMGIVNDHVQGCKFRSSATRARKQLDR